VLGCLVLFVTGVLSVFMSQFFALSGDHARVASIALLICGANLAISFPSNVMGSVLFGNQRIAEFNMINMLGVIINALLVLLVLGASMGVVGVAFVLLLAGLCVLMARVWYVMRIFPEISIGLRLFDRSMFIKVFSYSFFMFLLSIGSQIVFNTDNIVIARVLGVGMVASYAIAFRFNQFAMAFINKLSEVFYPFISELHAAGDRGRLNDYFNESTKLTVALATPIVFILIFWGQKILQLWIGPENVVIKPIIIILAGITLVSSIIRPGALALQGIGKVRELVLFNFLEALLNLAISIVLVIKVGLIGAAVGTIAAMCMTNLWYVPYKACKELKIPFLKYMIDNAVVPVLLGGVLMLFAYFIEGLLGSNSVMQVMLKAMLIMTAYATVFLFIGVNRQKRRLYLSKITDVVGPMNIFKKGGNQR